MRKNVFLVNLDNSRFDLFLAMTESHLAIEGFLLNLCNDKNNNGIYIEKINKYECYFEVNIKTKYLIPSSNIIRHTAKVSIDTIEIRTINDFNNLKQITHVPQIKIANNEKYKIMIQFDQRVKHFSNNKAITLNEESLNKSNSKINQNSTIKKNKIKYCKTSPVKNEVNNSKSTHTFNAGNTKVSWIDKMTKDVNNNIRSRDELEQILIKKDRIIVDEIPKVQKVKEEINLSEISILKKHGYDTSKTAEKRKTILDRIVPNVVTPTYAINFLQGQIRQKSAISNKDFSKSITAWSNDVLYLKKKYRI